MKDQLKRELAALLPEDTSTDLIVRLATYVEGKMGEERDYQKRKQYECIQGAIEALSDIENKVVVAVRIETDNSKAIKGIMAELEHAVANTLFKEARTKLFALLESPTHLTTNRDE